jgi:hypothetical protein
MTHPPQPPPGDPQSGQYGQPGPGEPPYGQPPYGQPGAHPQQPAGAYAQPPNAPGAVLSLVLGLISVLTCITILGPFAFVQGRKAEAAVEASGGAYGGKGIATAGKILGIIGTVFLVLTVLFVLLIVITGSYSANFETS